MIVKSNPLSSQPKKVARNAFHCSPLIWRYQGGAVGGVTIRRGPRIGSMTSLDTRPIALVGYVRVTIAP